MNLARTLFVIAALVTAACSAPPAGATKPATSPAQPPAASTNPSANDLPCREGDACSHDGETCGTERCAHATGFCNFMTCTSGHWSHVEVPPPAPGHP